MNGQHEPCNHKWKNISSKRQTVYQCEHCEIYTFEQPAQEQLTDLQKDAANLLFALHDAWPYVHQWCTIESKKRNIVHLMRKHGDFADLYAKQQQEPVAERFEAMHANGDVWITTIAAAAIARSTSPPASKPWVGLTDEEWQEIDASLNGKRDLARIFVKAIEAKLKEKNA